MCGIVGMVGHVAPDTIKRMTRMLSHRGPDGEGIECPQDEAFGFGHRRLAIIDLSPAGAQPMWDAMRRYCVAFNGEIYNFRFLRRELEASGHRFRSSSDTEVLLAAFVEWGANCVHRLNGMFAFAIWDRTTRSLFIARDRLGIKPLYWAEHEGGLLFASEAKAILASGLIKVAADPEVTHNPWHYPSSPRTGFLGILKLPPGHQLTWRDGNTTVSPWWSLPSDVAPIAHDDAAMRLEELLLDAIDLQLVADVPVGALLSGGLDSTTIVALMAKRTRRPVQTISIRFRSEDLPHEAMPQDDRFARVAARELGCEHTELEISPRIVDLLPKAVWHLDEPIFDPAAINTMLIAEEARRLGLTVLLSGMGGDEIFGGYRKHYACLLAEQYQRYVPKSVHSVLKSLGDRLPVATSRGGIRSVRWLHRFMAIAALPARQRFLQSDQSLSRSEYGAMFLDSSTRTFDELEEVQTRSQRFDAFTGTYLDRMCRWDTTVFLPDHNLTYTDKATMAAGIEARPPLIDHRIVELTCRLGDEDRIRGTVQKFLFRDVAAQWIPREIARRPKANFAAPLRAWIRRDLAEMVDDLLSESAIRRRGLYDPLALRRRIEEDRKGRADHAHLIWNLLNRELWFEAFIDNGGKALSAARGTVSVA